MSSAPLCFNRSIGRNLKFSVRNSHAYSIYRHMNKRTYSQRPLREMYLSTDLTEYIVFFVSRKGAKSAECFCMIIIGNNISVDPKLVLCIALLYLSPISSDGKVCLLYPSPISSDSDRGLPSYGGITDLCST